jgi:restriction system protein
MPIPDFETIMRPLLVHLSDRREYGTDDTFHALASHFRLTEHEKRQMQPGGRQGLFKNRVAWAKFYLKKAGVVATPRRGIYRITDRGENLLRLCPEQIDVETLHQFPEFMEFLQSSRRPETQSTLHDEAPLNPLPPASRAESLQAHLTPEEQIATGFSQINAHLAAELLERIKQGSPEFFENLVVELLLALGYGGSRQDAGQVVGRSGDEGIDGLIKEDRLGLDTIYVQAKRWENAIGRPEIQKFAGALQGQRAKKGIFITTAVFTREAQSFASSIESKIVLVDGDLLARLMIEHNVGVTSVAKYELKRIDSDYFTEE